MRFFPLHILVLVEVALRRRGAGDALHFYYCKAIWSLDIKKEAHREPIQADERLTSKKNCCALRHHFLMIFV